MTTVSEREREVPEPPAPVTFTHRQIQVILTGLMSGMFLAALDQTVVGTAIRTIADDLNGLSIQAWATTAYLITATTSSPLYGKLSDLHGRRPYFLTAISLFVLGSAACAMATTMYQLAACRALQGLGAGGLFSLALAIIGDMVPPRERARYQGYFLAVFGTSSVLGPMIGGVLADQSDILGIAGWRWVFLVNVPIGAASLLMVHRVLHLPHIRRDHRIDYAGAIALVVALVPLLLVAEQGREWGWTSGRSLLCYVVGGIGLVAFLVAEARCGDDALLPLHLFRGRTFAIGSLLNLLLGAGMFGGMICLPLYLQIVKGMSPTEAGFLLLPMSLGVMVGSVASGQMIARTGRYKIFPIVGLGLAVAGLLPLQWLAVDSSLVVLCLFTVVIGFGLGLNMQPLVLAIQNAVPAKDMGVATSSATFFRQMGGTIGTAAFLSVLFSTVTDRIQEAFGTAARTPGFREALTDPAVLGDPNNRPVLEALRGGVTGTNAHLLDDSSFLDRLDPRLAHPFLVGFADSLGLVFLIATGVMAVAFLVVLLLPEVPLRTQSGIQARAEEEAARVAAAPAATGH